MHTHSHDFQKVVTPEIALQILKEGNERFVKNLKTNRNLLEQVNATAEGQKPFATILSCMDSRTSAELIFDQGLGDIFSIRIAGNVLNPDILGSMEYATKVIGTKLILVLGHTRCGAVMGACDQTQLGNLTQLLQKIGPAVIKETTTKKNRNSKNSEFVQNVTILNVEHTIERIRVESPIISQLEKEGVIRIAGGIYDVETGQVKFLQTRSKQMPVPLAQYREA
jgi:carbonic anhydrase